MITRQKTKKTKQILELIKSSYTKLVGTEDTLISAKVHSDLVLLFLQGVNAKGVFEYDAQDRPLSNAFESQEIVENIIKEENNYLRAKPLLLLAKVYLAK